MRLPRLSLGAGLQTWREELREHLGEGLPLRAAAIAVAAYLLVAVILGMYWSREPKLFAVQSAAATLLKTHDSLAVGSTTVATLIRVTATLLDKPGGFLSNDIAPPGLWLDNIPAWEYGVLTQSRDLARVLRERFSRTQVGSAEDEDLGKVEPRLNFSSSSWALPSSESQYRDATRYMSAYLQRLQADGGRRAQFYANAENLSYWLAVVEGRLGNLSQRLSACVKPSDNPAALGSASEPQMLTPSDKVDDVFYEARGSAWALIHFLRAIDIDFADLLQQRNARHSLQDIIRDLQATQEPIHSPMILNGGGFGMLANHSLVMASYIARANAETINLRQRLTTDSF